MRKYNLGFRYVIQEIENENIGTIIESEDGNKYELRTAENGQRKYSRKDGTKLRFMTYDNINKMFRIVEENKEIEELKGMELINARPEVNARKINELVQAVNKLTKEREENKMILQASQTIIEFDGGDIAVGYGTKNGIGKIVFQDLEEKQEIGTKVENSNYIFPVIFEFKKEESIDVVIEQLQSLKEQMKEREEK